MTNTEKNISEEILSEARKRTELLKSIAGEGNMPKKSTVIDTPIAIFLVAGLYLMVTGQNRNTQFLGILLTGIGLLFMWGKH